MADRRFFQYGGPFSLAELAVMIGASLERCPDPSVLIDDIGPISTAGPTDLTFLENSRYSKGLRDSRAGACLITANHADHAPPGMALLLTERPRRNFARLSQRFYPEPVPEPGVHPTASIAESVTLGPDCRVGPGVVIGANARIGARCFLEANTVIDDAVEIGPDTRIGANATLSHCIVGTRCYIYAGVTIGQCGFGFESDASGIIKMPHLGRVLVGDDVEIGANCTVDRGTGPDTTIGQGTMIDNLVHIGHNVHIGRGCIIAAMVGIAGSARLEDRVVIAGQSGVTGHVTVGAGVQVAARTGVTKDIGAGQRVAGMPAVPVRDFRRQIAMVRILARRGVNRVENGTA